MVVKGLRLLWGDHEVRRCHIQTRSNMAGKEANAGGRSSIVYSLKIQVGAKSLEHVACKVSSMWQTRLVKLHEVSRNNLQRSLVDRDGHGSLFGKSESERVNEGTSCSIVY